MTKNVRQAAVSVAGSLLWAGVAHAQTPSVPEATPPPPAAVTPAEAPANTEEIAYEDYYFEPFIVSNPELMLANPRPWVPMPPLIAPFDPLDDSQATTPLLTSTKTSRVALPGNRVITYLPVIHARVGEEVTVTLKAVRPPALMAVRARIRYDPDIVEAMPPRIVPQLMKPGVEFDYNMNPVGDSGKGHLLTLVTTLYPWEDASDVFDFRFRALKAGESPLASVLMELVRTDFEMEPVIFRSGLIHVRP